MGAVPDVTTRKKVLLFDTDHRRREIRAANLRMRGVDVVCARNVEEVRDCWHPDVFRLVLLEATDCPAVVKFSEEVRGDFPHQQLAFFVGKPGYLAAHPATETDTDFAPALPEVDAALTVEDAFKTLSQRNGFVEASLRMQMLRKARRGATVEAPKSPWDAFKKFPDAD